jgi:hypothetical protein
LWIVAQFPVDDPDAVESALHDILEEKHVRGEWFELDHEDYDELADMVRMAASEQEFSDVEEFREWQERKRHSII